MAVVSWGEKEIFTKGVSDDQNKERGGDWENISPFAPPPPPPPSDASIPNHIWPVEKAIASFLKLTRPNKTPELQLPICLFLLRATDIANLHVISYHNLVNALWCFRP